MSVKINKRYHPNQPLPKGVKGPDAPKTALDGGNPNVIPSLGVVGVAAAQPAEVSASQKAVKAMGRDHVDDVSDPDSPNYDPDDPDFVEGRKK
jgi:hypothetical protein